MDCILLKIKMIKMLRTIKIRDKARIFISIFLFSKRIPISAERYIIRVTEEINSKINLFSDCVCPPTRTTNRMLIAVAINI